MTRQAHERPRIQRLPERGERVAARQVPGRGREDVAAVERRGRSGRHGELAGRRDTTAALGGRDEQAVVGPHEQPAVAARERDGPPIRADPRIDDGDVDADRHVRERVGERSGALCHGAGCNSVREVQHACIRRHGQDRALDDSRVRIPRAEVRQERDERHAGTLRRVRAQPPGGGS